MRIGYLAGALSVVASLATGSQLGAQQMAYGVSSWKTEGVGNQRAVVEVAGKAEAAWARSRRR